MNDEAVFQYEDVIRTFSELSTGWSQKNSSIQTRGGIRNRLIELLPSIIMPQEHLLDVGCGNGKVATLLRNRGLKNQITMIDGAVGMITSAQKNFVNDPSTQILQTSLEDFVSAQDREYDVISALQVLHHVYDLPTFLKAATRSLKPGGQMIALTVGSKFHHEALPFNNPKDDPLGRKHSYEWETIFSESGFFVNAVINDYFEVKFMNIREYHDYLAHIGSLSKMNGYKSVKAGPLAVKAGQKWNEPITLTGHHVTIVAQKKEAH